MGKVGVALVLIPAILSSFISFTSQDQLRSNNRRLINDLNEAKLHVSRLESTLDEVNSNVKDRDLYLSQLEQRIQDLEKAKDDLESSLSSMKEESLRAEGKIIALEEEARLLWASLRKNNFDIHVLESKVREAEDRLNILTSQAENMLDIVNEQWVQIQQFEQALLLGEMRLVKVQHQLRSSRWPFFKYVNSFYDNCLQKGRRICISLFGSDGSALRSYVFQTSDQLQGLYSLVKEFHHKLQGIIKEEMGRHELTAKVANEELVFFVASALIVFPILSAWVWLSSQWH